MHPKIIIKPKSHLLCPSKTLSPNNISKKKLPKNKIKIDEKKLNIRKNIDVGYCKKNKALQLAKKMLQSQGLFPSTASLTCLYTHKAGFISPEIVS